MHCKIDATYRHGLDFRLHRRALSGNGRISNIGLKLKFNEEFEIKNALDLLPVNYNNSVVIANL